MLSLLPAAVDVSARADGSLVLRSPAPLRAYPRCLGDLLDRWALEAPERTFLAERDPSGAWRRVSYRDARRVVRSVARGLVELGAAPDRPVMLLSDNSVDHALVQLASMHAGVPAAPISPAYSLASKDFAKLRAIASMVGPGVIYVSDRATFARALEALDLRDVPVVTTLDELSRASPLDAPTSIGPDTVAKILFTSGSTGHPKGVVNTQRMLCSNQQAILQAWPFLGERPPVIVDWLPWSHTFGGNHNFNMVLMNGGTLYVDAGKPMPGRIDATIANLREVSPTLYFNVPRGYDILVGHLEADADLRARFFAELDVVFYAAAALAQSTWERLEKVAAERDVMMTSAWGSTETSPLVTTVHFRIPRAGVIGLPAPGCELKLAPREGKLEMRVRGPNVTPGYWERGGAVTPLALDDDGFYSTGDAGRLEDAREPSRGVVFDGRTAENFKLSSGTWVSVGELRVRAIAACAPAVADAVVAGHDRERIALLVFAAPGASDVVERVRAGLGAHNTAHPGTSTRVARALILDEPPSIDGGEITDKGYLNQRRILERRAEIVTRVYADPPGDDVIVLE